MSRRRDADNGELARGLGIRVILRQAARPAAGNVCTTVSSAVTALSSAATGAVLGLGPGGC